MPWTTDKTRIYSKEQQVMINKLEEKMLAFKNAVIETTNKTEQRINRLIKIHALTLLLALTLICVLVVK